MCISLLKVVLALECFRANGLVSDGHRMRHDYGSLCRGVSFFQNLAETDPKKCLRLCGGTISEDSNLLKKHISPRSISNVTVSDIPMDSKNWPSYPEGHLSSGEEALLNAMQKLSLKEKKSAFDRMALEDPELARKLKQENEETENINWNAFNDEVDKRMMDYYATKQIQENEDDDPLRPPPANIALDVIESTMKGFRKNQSYAAQRSVGPLPPSQPKFDNEFAVQAAKSPVGKAAAVAAAMGSAGAPSRNATAVPGQQARAASAPPPLPPMSAAAAEATDQEEEYDGPEVLPMGVDDGDAGDAGRRRRPPPPEYKHVLHDPDNMEELMSRLIREMWTAAENGDASTMHKLVKLGVDVNVKHPTVFNWTAAHMAAINNHPDVLEVLQEARADLLLRDASGRTPLRLAKKNHMRDAVDALSAIMGYPEGQDGSDTEVSSDIFDPVAHAAGLRKDASNPLPEEDFVAYYKKRKERKARQRESSRRRREKYFGPEDPVDKDGVTSSQREHMARLLRASEFAKQTGLPMERYLGIPEAKDLSDELDVPKGHEGPNAADNDPELNRHLMREYMDDFANRQFNDDSEGQREREKASQTAGIR